MADLPVGKKVSLTITFNREHFPLVRFYLTSKGFPSLPSYFGGDDIEEDGLALRHPFGTGAWHKWDLFVAEFPEEARDYWNSVSVFHRSYFILSAFEQGNFNGDILKICWKYLNDNSRWEHLSSQVPILPQDTIQIKIMYF
jgi:hypothetical protein